MPSKGKVKARTKKRHILLILFFIGAVIFFLYEELGKEGIQRGILDILKPEEKPPALPKVAIVIDDLGPSKKAALEVFNNIKAPLTLSIFPDETYTAWIAEEGHRLGYDIIGHIPMEAKEPRKLGKGGLYTWMSQEEIHKTLKENISSIPHIKGVSNHMGSAFTEDERTMHDLMGGLKREGLFFLDSLTTGKSVGVRVANAEGIRALRRDVFLDEKDNPEDIKAQWENVVKTAKKRGYAIAIAHPKKNTIEFLKNTLIRNEVTLVTISELSIP